ncbi:MAG: hypothetical protein RMM53_05450 [Bacteroidia bacterium]|nr:hypothetical protein [Bacteroidia bacterium]MDW8333643.1 hypothetical protein [Bacteroidia bacterium]
MKKAGAAWAMSCALAAASLWLEAQIIDTAVWPYVTADDTVNTFLKRLSGVDVTLDRPKILNRKGVKIPHGFGNYYLYVVSTRLALVNGVPIADTVQRDLYLPVTSRFKKLKLDSLPVIHSRALFLQGLYDVGPAELQAAALHVADCKQKADSVLALLEEHRAAGRVLPKRMLAGYEAMCDEVDVSAHLYRLYERFVKIKKIKKAKKRGRKLAKFFSSNAFNNRSLRYNAVSSPYGLPEIRDEVREQLKTPDRPDSTPVIYEENKPVKTKEAFKEQRPDREYKDFENDKDGD